MLINTKDEEIIELFKIYNYLKYFYHNIIKDIESAIIKLFLPYNEIQKIIESLINPIELKTFYNYVDILKNKFNIFITDNLQYIIFDADKHFYKIIKIYILIRLNLIDKIKLSTKYLNKYSVVKYNTIKHYKRFYAPNSEFSEFLIIFNYHISKIC